MRDWLGRVVDRDDLTRHDKWCCMILPRLKLLRELLREDGAIFVSINDNEVHHLRSLSTDPDSIILDSFAGCGTTAQALQEGWDCPFAYVLTILTNPMSKTGITQLVGRILRQPYASKTGVSVLDESYVFCFSGRGNELLKEVRKGFGVEGLQGLEGRVVPDDGSARPPEKLATRQRARYRAAARDLVLPAFMIW